MKYSRLIDEKRVRIEEIHDDFDVQLPNQPLAQPKPVVDLSNLSE